MKSSRTSRFTPFENEILDSILWQVEGFKSGRVTRRATTRILRATLRRIQPRLIARSEAAKSGKNELDHAVPVHTICDRILSAPDLDRSTLESILGQWLVGVELAPFEHREALKKCGLTNCMPHDWDEIDLLARYRVAGIRLMAVDE